MTLLIATELFMLFFTIHTLSATRAYVSGEGLWSKAEKDAVYNLRRYVKSHKEVDYLAFIHYMKVPLGDHKARVELQKKQFSYAVARDGFLEGRNDPADIDGMIKLFRRFHNVFYIKKAIYVWTQGDTAIDQLKQEGAQLHQMVLSGDTGEKKVTKLTDSIYKINKKLTVLEDSFSNTLGQGSRWLEGLVLKVLLIVALTVECTGLFLTISVSIAMSKGIKEVIRVSHSVAKGNMSERAEIYSADEIGQLAYSFNQMVVDIQEQMQKRSEAEEKLLSQKNMYETLINAQSEMGEGVAITEGDQFVFVNRALCDMFGYSMDEILAMPSFMDVVVEGEREVLLDKLDEEEGKGNPEHTGETLVRRKDGKVMTVEYSMKQVMTDDKVQFISIVRDITDKKMAEQQLIESSEKIQESNKELEHFAYTVSHDLREPLRTINSYIKLLEKRYHDKLDNEANEFIGFAVDGAMRMDRLINDLLTYSRVTRKEDENELEALDCGEILTTVQDTLHDMITESKAKITVEQMPVVKGNETRLTQLFQNLVSNAIKFHGSKRPEVHISSEEKPDEWLLSVKDNGIGLDTKYKDKVFAVFQRLHAIGTYEGTGIGLAICKKIVEQYGGRIWLDSEIGKGTTIYFTLKKNIESTKSFNK